MKLQWLALAVYIALAGNVVNEPVVSIHHGGFLFLPCIELRFLTDICRTTLPWLQKKSLKSYIQPDENEKWIEMQDINQDLGCSRL